MDNTLSTLLNIMLACICLWHIVQAYFSKDKTKIWSPITFLSLSYLYYCVIPMFETDGVFMGFSSSKYSSLFHVAALLSFLSILWGFYKINFSFKTNKLKWNSCFNENNYKRLSVLLFIIALLCYVPLRGFKMNLFTTGSEITEYDWDNQGFNFYFTSMISLFVTSCCLLVARIKENKILFAFILWISLVTYIISGFRYRIIILVIAMFTTYFLYDKSRKIRIVPVAIVGLLFFFLFNVMDIARSYGNGIQIDLINSDDLSRKAGETDHVYNYSVLVVGRYHETGRMEYFNPVVNAILMPLPRMLFPWKPKGDYTFEASNFVMKGNDGSAYMGFVEGFMAFSWFGIIFNGLFVGWLSRRFWNYYKKNPKSMSAIIALAIFNGFTYVIVSRGYLALQLSVFLYFVCLPFVLARLYNTVFTNKNIHSR